MVADESRKREGYHATLATDDHAPRREVEVIELGLTIVIYGLAWWWLNTGRAPGRLTHLSQGLQREHVAVVLLALASHSRVMRAGAADSMASPFVIETVLRGVFVVASVAVILPAATKTVALSKTFRRGHWGVLALVVYACAASMSVLYAVGLFQTGGKVAELVALVLIVWHLASRSDGAQAIAKTLYLVLVLEAGTLLVSVLGFFAVPSLFAKTLTRPGFIFATTLEGPLGSANDTSATGGLLLAVGLAVWTSKARDSRRLIWPAFMVIGASSVLLASGRQGVAIMVGAAALALWANNRQAFIFLAVPGIATILLFAADTIFSSLLRDQAPGSVETLSGRTVFWSSAIRAFRAQPLSGYGFGGSRFSVLADIGADQYTHLHNGYLEALVGVGLIGFVPLMVAALLALRWSIRCLRRRTHVELAVLVPALLAQNAIGQGFGGWLNGNLIFFALLVGLADASRSSDTIRGAAPKDATSRRVSSKRASSGRHP